MLEVVFPLWVISGHFAKSHQCLLYPVKRTFIYGTPGSLQLIGNLIDAGLRAVVVFPGCARDADRVDNLVAHFDWQSAAKEDRHFAWQHSSGPKVRFGSKADILGSLRDVRFTPESGHRPNAISTSAKCQ